MLLCPVVPAVEEDVVEEVEVLEAPVDVVEELMSPEVVVVLQSIKLKLNVDCAFSTVFLFSM